MEEGRRVSSRTIVGRDDQLRAFDALLAEAAAGAPRMLVLAGEAGVGKTRLTTELEARAGERGMLVLHGEAIELGGEEFAYAPVIAALRAIPHDWLADALDDDAGAELAALLPRFRLDTARAGPPRFADRYGQGRMCELLLDLLGRLARDRRPLLLVLEDLHWADRSTRDLVAFLARNLRDERIAVALTFRTGELPPGHPLRLLLTELARRPVVLRIDLEPLDRDGVARQLEAIAGRPVPTTLAEELHARSGGNPFFVEELFAAGGAGDVPATVAEAVAARADRLAPAAQRLLAIVAAAGGRLRHDALERVAEGPGELGPALREALDGGLLVRDRDDAGVALRHGLIGEVVYGALVPSERAALHRELGAALEATGAPVAELAHQWHRAGEHAAALAASVEAGRAAARVYAFAEALGHLERALALWPQVRPDRADRVELLSLAAQAARFAGDRERAVALGREALEQHDVVADPLRAARLYERLGEYQSWDDAAALECYETALAHLPDAPSAERARLLAAEGHALMGLRRWDEARDRCEAALAEAAEAGDEAPTVAARMTLGLVLGFLGDSGGGERQLREALDTGERIGAWEETARAYVHLGELLRLRGDHAGALDAMVAGERFATRRGMAGSFGRFMFVNAADDLLRLGRWGEAARRLEAAERMDLGVTAAAMQATTAGHLHALRGEPDPAREHLGRALALIGEELPAEFFIPARSAWAALALAESDPGAARAHVDAALAAGGTHDPLYAPALLAIGVRAEADLAERARALRRPEEVEEAAARADALLADMERVMEAPDAIAHLRLARAERARLAGDGEPAAEGPDLDRAAAWAAAVSAWDDLGEPYPAAYARLRQAEALLIAANDRRGAAALLGSAHATAATLGAAPLREAIEALARRARLDLGEGAAEVPGARDDDDMPLTERETDVLRLLAEGLTNREIAGQLFISEKTVGTHVAHIFEKLGVHGRVEAAGRAQVLGVIERPR